MNMIININLNSFIDINTFSNLPILLHTYTYVTAVTNGAIKVALSGTTCNRTLVNSVPDQ